MGTKNRKTQPVKDRLNTNTQVMQQSKNEKVQHFLEEVNMIDSEKSDILNTIRTLIFKHYPKTEEKFMYGGIIFSLNEEHFSGLFVRKNHVSLEFGNGFKMDDPNQLLEGGGKFRRHLKIKSYWEIKSKQVEFFVNQAV